MIKMNIEIINSLKEYIGTVENNVQNIEKRTKGTLTLFRRNIAYEVIQLEKSDEFKQLISESQKLESPFVESSWYKDISLFTVWQNAIKNFFRRSGIYLNLFNGKRIDFDDITKNYENAFDKKETKVIYLAPIEYVYFSKEILNFKTFMIKRFSEKELNEIINQEVNEYFYSFATIDTKMMKNYWFIQIDDIESFSKDNNMLDFNEIDIVKFEHTDYPNKLELVLKKLSLFSWAPDLYSNSSEKQKIWFGFNIPFFIKADDNILNSPLKVNYDFRKLENEPFFHPATNEIVDRPATYFHFDKRETDDFERFINEIDNIFIEFDNYQAPLHFFDIALGYFIKAFFSDGLEQLLWHISTVEALLGEKAPGLTQLLARRTALILSKERKEREIIRKQFKELYNFRSNLVHGNPFSAKKNKSVYVGHLNNAREIARKSILWFIFFVNKYSQSQNGKIQEELLTAIDLEPESIEISKFC